MKIYNDTQIRDFEFWSGATERAASLTDEDWDTVEPILEDMYPDGMADVELNDLFWFEFDMIVGWLGFDNELDFDRKRDPYYVDDDELEERVAPWFSAYLAEVYRKADKETVQKLYEGVFSESLEELCGDVEWETDYPDSVYVAAMDKMNEMPASDLMGWLFDDDNAHRCIADFPTKEQFRDEIMQKLKTDQNAS